MSKITLDPGLKLKLNGMNEPMEICDECGVTVGHFLSEATYHQLLSAWAKTHVSDGEIASLRQETGGKTLAEIWRELGQT